MLSLIVLHATSQGFLSGNVFASAKFAMAADEAMEDVQTGMKRPTADLDSLKNKKFKAEDLPLTAAQHAAIDRLLHSFRKKGGFDNVRKKIWAEFNDGVCMRATIIS